MPKKTSPTSKTVKAKSSSKKPVQKTDVSKIRALEEQLAQRDAEIARLSADNQRLLKETEQRATELQIINNIGQTLTEGLDLDSTLERVCKRLHQALGVDDFGITVFDTQTGLAISHYIIRGGKRVAAQDFSLDKYRFGMRLALKRGSKPWVVNTNAEKYWNKIGSVTNGDEAPKSFAMLPMLAGRELVGSITFVDFEKENAFPDLPLDMLETIASNMGTAIQNVHLFDETQRLLKETEQRATELQIINNIGQTLTKGLDLNSTLERVGERLRETLKFENFGIVAYDAQTELAISLYIVRNSRRVDSERFASDKYRLAMRLASRREGKPWVVNTNAEKYWIKFGTVLDDEIAKSFVMFPLLAGRVLVGSITIADYEKENAFVDFPISLIETIASNIGTVVQNVRLFDETQRLLKQTEQRATELQIINNIGQTLTEGGDLESTIQRVGERLREALKIENIGFSVWDEKLEHIVAKYYYRNGKPASSETWLAGDVKMALRLAARGGGRSWVVNRNAEKSWRKFGGVNEVDSPKSFVQLPLLAGGKLVGGITIADYEKEDAFTDLSVGMLETISSNMGTAIQNARLFDETQRLLKETEQRATELQIINNIGQTLTEGLDLDSTLERVGERLREALGIKSLGIVAFDSQEGLAISNYMYHYGRRIIPQRFSMSNYKSRMRIASRVGSKPWVVNTNVEKYWKKFGASILTDWTEIPKAFVMVPLLAGGELVGSITIGDYEDENAFVNLPLNLLETIASNMGTAIQNVRLFDETKKLFKEAQDARAAAEHANKAKSTFLANMSHELRTPLNAIMGFTSIVRMKAEGVLPEKQIGNLDKVTSSSEHLLGLINTALDIAKIEAGRMDVIPAKFNVGVLADICANIATPLLRSNVTLEKQVDDNVNIIFSDQDKIKQIVLNLLSNAAKFTHNGSILLRVNKINEETVNISVTDSGIGISAEALGRVFEEFQQADNTTTRQYGGTGLGLAISRNLARLLGGDLTVTSEFGKGSTFTLTTPTQYGYKPASRAVDPKPDSVQLTESHTLADANATKL